ncbi:MAG: N-acetylneuraminate synthase family protein [Phycisphaerae bacterium]|jgi:N-acetylneuraminate synthase/N,N'-diacetyllegionaminate synthase
MPPCCSSGSSPPPSPEQRTDGQTRIGSRLIAPGQPAYIVAEAGVNHDGSTDKAHALIDVAAQAGADAVKFQVFHAAELATAGAATAGYQQATGQTSQQQMLAALELTDAAFHELRDHCRQRGLEFLATPFSPADVERLRQLDVRAIKIASTDLNNTPLLQAAAEADLPLIVSTGAATFEELRTAVMRLRFWGTASRLILLHCVSCYPTPLEAANLRAVAELSGRFSVPAGFSDHTLSTHVGGWAVAAGACLLEKHFTLDRSASGPDHAMSLTPAELSEYVAIVRTVEAALGTGQLGMTEIEADVRAVARKSVVAARAIPAGTPLTPDMLTIKRPAGGVQPDLIHSLVGRTLRTDVAADTVLTWDLIA